MFPNFTHTCVGYFGHLGHTKDLFDTLSQDISLLFFYIPYQESRQTLLCGLANENVKKCIKGITIPKISVKRRKVSCKTPFWPRLFTDWGKIAGTGSPSSSLFASLASAFFGLFLALLWFLFTPRWSERALGDLIQFNV